MNTTLTLQEILKEYGYTKLPKGTTEQQWFDYHEKVLSHDERVKRETPDPENYPSEDTYMSAVSEWKMMRSCDAPNVPGYFRSNND